MRWIVMFDDEPGMLAVRQARGEAHLAYLREHQDEILIGGGCRETPEGDFVGGLWVLEVDSKARAIALIENDPYYEPAHRRYRLRTWGKVLAERDVLL